jgi:hypothetical protein
MFGIRQKAFSIADELLEFNAALVKGIKFSLKEKE